jgi:hypothetical protein
MMNLEDEISAWPHVSIHPHRFGGSGIPLRKRGSGAHASRELPPIGYTSVGDYPDGKQSWMEAELPVEKGA